MVPEHPTRWGSVPAVNQASTREADRPSEQQRAVPVNVIALYRRISIGKYLDHKRCRVSLVERQSFVKFFLTPLLRDHINDDRPQIGGCWHERGMIFTASAAERVTGVAFGIVVVSA
jgi:hypothetical protein